MRIMKSKFNGQDITIGVPNSNRNFREPFGDFEEEEDYEPLVFQIIAIVKLPVEVGDVVKGNKERKARVSLCSQR